MVIRERGQLLLAGALLVAIIFIGLAVLLNSVVFTENVSGGSSVEVTGDVNEFNKEMRRNTRVLTIRVNHGGNYTSLGEIDASLAANFTNYSRVLAESYADTGATYANVSYGGTVTEGRRITQRDEQTFEKGGSDDWDAFGGSKELGWFVMNVNVSETKENQAARIELTNASGSTYSLTLQQSPGGKLLVNSSLDGSSTSNATCSPTAHRVVIDVIDGTSPTADCTFNGSERLQGPYDSLEFENASAATGEFAIVVNGTSNIGVASCASTKNPCKMTAAWAVEITTRYETVELAYANTQTVTVYLNE